MRTTTAAFVFASLTALSGGWASRSRQPRPAAKPPLSPFHLAPSSRCASTTQFEQTEARPGEFFTGAVVTPINSADGNAAIHEGALVRGRVVAIDQPAGIIRISFQMIDTTSRRFRSRSP